MFLKREKLQYLQKVQDGLAMSTAELRKQRDVLAREARELNARVDELEVFEQVLDARVTFQIERRDVLRRQRERREGVTSQALCFTLLDNRDPAAESRGEKAQAAMVKVYKIAEIMQVWVKKLPLFICRRKMQLCLSRVGSRPRN